MFSQVMIAIGGWNEGSTKYSGMAKDKKKRQKFVNSTLDFLQKHNFDGIYYKEDQGSCKLWVKRCHSSNIACDEKDL